MVRLLASPILIFPSELIPFLYSVRKYAQFVVTLAFSSIWVRTHAAVCVQHICLPLSPPRLKKMSEASARGSPRLLVCGVQENVQPVLADGCEYVQLHPPQFTSLILFGTGGSFGENATLSHFRCLLSYHIVDEYLSLVTVFLRIVAPPHTDPTLLQCCPSVRCSYLFIHLHRYSVALATDAS